jgi:hypothetical protein
MMTPGVGAPAALHEPTRIISRVPIGVPLNARPAPARPAAASPAATRPTTRAYPHPIRTVRPRTP